MAQGTQVLQLMRFGILTQILLLVLLVPCISDGAGIKKQTVSASGVSRSSRPALQQELDRMLDRELAPYSLASIKVVSLKSGAILYERNPYLLMPAASLQKLFTAAAALSLLGPDHGIETSISVHADTSTLYVKGCGDPLLTTEDLFSLVTTPAIQFSNYRNYKLIGDTSCFDDTYWGSGWMWDDEPYPDAMYLSALSVNGNTVGVTAYPGKTAGSSLEVVIDPPTRHVEIDNRATTGKREGTCAVTLTRAAGDRDNRILVTGSLAPGCKPVSKRLSVWRPDQYLVTLLAELLGQTGAKTTRPSMGITPADAAKLAVIQHPVSEIVSAMLKSSDNLSAENLLKYLAHTKSGQKGTSSEGAGIIKEYLRLNGISTEQMVIADGSGVSRYNLTNADTITRLLAAVYNDQVTSSTFINSLPVAGNNGTLSGRMKGTPAEGKLKAKTGTMNGLSALAGYTVTADGEPLAFSMIMQNFVGSAQRIRDLQDRIAVRLGRVSHAQSGNR